ncbi:GntR family transcriptional regulator [Subtercola sp. RTI3]|uniref:GntR family transcriptional regulator n=1 Tax=Subtercola sp. RTI3 TaxID=3048639 RepID=UPI002B2229B5|nr:GntR family transcriptional regulator [Subtercola sp. RTI3]MEA9987138.1 GntR family transcriptional regulator [Subtercola sp. RTI3]
MFAGEGPIFQQLAAKIADDIVGGTYAEETAVPSATDFAVFHQMNPATASKGVNMLVELGVLYKKRGIGMFVATGARDVLLRQRREEFRAQYMRPLLREALVLDITASELHSMIDDEEQDPA